MAHVTVVGGGSIWYVAASCWPCIVFLSSFSLVEIDTGKAVLTDTVRYGLRVAVVALPCSPVLTTPEGLAAVSPQAFGYDDSVAYNRVAEFKPNPPVV